MICDVRYIVEIIILYDDDYLLILDKILVSDIIIFVLLVYWYSILVLLKVFIEYWLEIL